MKSFPSPSYLANSTVSFAVAIDVAARRLVLVEVHDDDGDDGLEFVLYREVQASAGAKQRQRLADRSQRRVMIM